MSNTMLIDATHREETRVAVVRGNRIEEYDFESQEKKQLRGNIYLAKVTRVEPSLQAAFIDYGGNRHGFLAFSEIHPDYYQIPVADRQALIEAEAAEARASREADEAEDSKNVDEEDAEAEAPTKPRRGRRPRKAKSAEVEADNENPADTSDEKPTSGDAGGVSDENAASSESNNEAANSGNGDALDEAPKKKLRRSTTRRKAPAKKASKEEEASDDQASDAEANPEADQPAGTPKTMSAAIESDEISEPLKETNASGSDASGNAPKSEAEAEEKPKRKRTARPRKRRNAKAEEADNTETGKDTADEAVKATAEDASTGTDGKAKSGNNSSDDDGGETPRRKKSRRKPARKKKGQADSAENGNDEDGNGEASVESVGQEDALEEVPVQRRARKHYKIQEVIKRRQVMLVQVVKEERGTKGAALTTYLSLAGRYSVLMPNTARGGGISRKITNAADRKRLKAVASALEVPNGMGVILRTAGASRTKDEINRDFDYLMRLWGQVRTLTLSSTAPCLVYEEGSLIKRSIRDLYDKDTGEILVAGMEGYNEAREFMNMLIPSHTRKVKQYKGSQAIFAKNGVEAQLDNMLTPQVTLKSGGYLVINQTEALVAVDVNSGRSTREHSVEDTALKTNLEAAEEVARQLRLRDLAGLIVIDFIDMEERRNNQAVEKKLKEYLKNDRARIQVGRISHFGLMEMSRQRMRASVLESTMNMCEHCSGIGFVRSDSAISLHIFRAIEEHVSRQDKFDCVVKTNPSIALHILNHKRQSLLELEARHGLRIFIESDPDVSGQEFQLEKGEPASGEKGPLPIGFQNEAAREDVDDNGNAKNKPRRGVRRRNARAADDDSRETSADTADTSETTADTRDEADTNNGSRRRTSRGNRGNRNAGNALKQSSEDIAVAGHDDEQKPDADSETETKSRKSGGRSTVRRKAPIVKKPDTPSAGKETKSETGSAPTPTDEPPRKPRRTTRRKASEKTGEKIHQASEATSPASPVLESAESDKQETGNGEKKKKPGWWSGGLF